MKRSLFRLVAFKKQLGVSSRLIHQDVKTQIQRFDASIPVEKAITPPSSWFTHQLFHDLDKVSNCSFALFRFGSRNFYHINFRRQFSIKNGFVLEERIKLMNMANSFLDVLPNNHS